MDLRPLKPYRRWLWLLHDDIVATSGYYTDALGSADWRRGVSAVLGEEIRTELSSATNGIKDMGFGAGA